MVLLFSKTKHSFWTFGVHASQKNLQLYWADYWQGYPSTLEQPQYLGKVNKQQQR